LRKRNPKIIYATTIKVAKMARKIRYDRFTVCFGDTCKECSSEKDTRYEDTRRRRDEREEVEKGGNKRKRKRRGDTCPKVSNLRQGGRSGSG